MPLQYMSHAMRAARKIIKLTFTEFDFFSLIGCLTSHAKILQLYMWRHIDVQAEEV